MPATDFSDPMSAGDGLIFLIQGYGLPGLYSHCIRVGAFATRYFISLLSHPMEADNPYFLDTLPYATRTNISPSDPFTVTS